MEKTLERRLIEFYDRYLPNNAGRKNISVIAKKYVGKEDKLFAYLHKKYAEEIASAKRKEREALDFLSDKFDAKKVLFCSDIDLICLPEPDAMPLDNITKCKSLLPENDEHYDKRILMARKVTTSSTTKKKSSVLKTGKLSSVADCFQVGPMSLLRKCFRNKSKISVRTRAIAGERGRISGVLDAFDKHMNLILRNAVETQLVKVEGSKLLESIYAGHPKPASLRGLILKKDKTYTIPVIRKFRSLLVRGDMVILISENVDDKKYFDVRARRVED